jgi:hypothetical protein
MHPFGDRAMSFKIIEIIFILKRYLTRERFIFQFYYDEVLDACRLDNQLIYKGLQLKALENS